MTEPQDVPIESITYTHEGLKDFILDKLLDRVAPISALTDPEPQQRVVGSLSVLPVELLVMVLDNLTIIDAMRFRRSNRFAMHVVDTESALSSSLQFAPNVVKGMMAIRCTSRITSQQLRDKLCQRVCDNRVYGIKLKPGGGWVTEERPCERLAEHIFLPGCRRSCVRCIRRAEYFTWQSSLIRVIYGLQFEDFGIPPSFRTLPVTLTNVLNKLRLETHETPYLCSIATTIREKGMNMSPSMMEQLYERVHARWEFERSMKKQDSTLPSVTVIPDFPCFYTDRMAIVSAPWVDPGSSPMERGVYCTLCQGTIRDGELFIRESFLDHLKDCRVRPVHLGWGTWPFVLEVNAEASECDKGKVLKLDK